MSGFLIWPHKLLIPESASAVTTPFSRSGGTSFGGLTRASRTDRGFWRVTLTNVRLNSVEQRRTWDALDTALGGMSGLIAVPVWAFDTAPHLGGIDAGAIETTHDDDTLFDDETPYVQDSLLIEMATYAPLSATTVTIRILEGEPEPSGIRFGYQYASYKTGRVLEQISENSWRVEITPAIRAPIPADSILEASAPMTLCHLVSDTGMRRDTTTSRVINPSVEFVEATDFWSDYAVGLAG